MEPRVTIAGARRCAEEVRSSAGRDVQVEAATETVGGSLGCPRYRAGSSQPADQRVQVQSTGKCGDGPGQARGERRHAALLVVQDEGIGIPTDVPRIFERYRRGRNVGRIAGTGIGLTGAKQIVERHGGAIDVASAEGAGTRMTVDLPLEPPAVD